MSSPDVGSPVADKAKFHAAKDDADGAPKSPGLAECDKKQPKIAVNWRVHDFGRIRKGKTSDEHELVITSTGTKDLAAINVQLNGDEFQMGGGHAATLPPGHTTSVMVKFKPTSFGRKKGTILITSNAVNENPITVQVKGKQFAVITFVVEEDKTAKKIEKVTLKVKQAGRKAKEITTGVGGKVELETEHEGKFEVQLGDYEDLLEFRSLTTA